jgi:hypothetical protein
MEPAENGLSDARANGSGEPCIAAIEMIATNSAAPAKTAKPCHQKRMRISAKYIASAAAPTAMMFASLGNRHERPATGNVPIREATASSGIDRSINRYGSSTIQFHKG